MDRLWRSKTTLQPKTMPKQQLLLPNSIGCRIIELQMEMDDGNINKQLIIQLLQQYTKAVQFYQEKEDERHKMYQKKIQNLLQKPTVDAILKGGENPSNLMKVKKQKAQQQIRKATHINKNDVKKIMEHSDQGIQKAKQKMQKQLNFQLQNLEQRLKRKRINSQRAKVSSASFSTPSNKDEGFFISFQEVKNPKHKVLM